MRTLLTGIAVAVMTILLAPVAVAAHVLGVFPEERHVQQWCMRTWARVICRAAGARVVLHGGEQIGRARGVVYASNHVSWFDIFALATVLPRYTFVAKAELRRIPIFGWGAEGAGVVFLSRDNRKSAFEAYESVAQEITHGRSVVVCPEGTRGDDYHLRPFKKGPFVLAIAAKAPVVPVVVFGAREVMRRGSWTIRPGTVHVHLLPRVETAGFDYEHRHELMTAVWTPMAEMLRDRYEVPIRATSNEQRATSNEQRATSNEQRATSNE
ncbi:MAG: 1-acyl-sn-glycerol-3-phosphate acyltransferase [Gemmatimonadetes bacterium]|nr:1-acyl-sn-glycerol-3-phosphate acyltransferase [Gemmatimonadota bacterium]